MRELKGTTCMCGSGEGAGTLAVRSLLQQPEKLGDGNGEWTGESRRERERKE